MEGVGLLHPLTDRPLGDGITVEGDRVEIEIRAPFTDRPCGRLPRCDARDVALALERARPAQRAWAEVPPADRARVLLRFHDLVLERRDEVLDLIQLETGKARRNAFEELADVALVTRFYALTSPRLLRPRRRRGALPGLTATWEHRHPRGVVGFISPWNYPLSMAITDAIPALAAGNAALLKPDLQTSFTALWALHLLREAGLPADVFQIVTGDGPETGAAVVDAVDYVAFTGSTATGREVARRAAGRLIGCSLELGGKNPMLVCADADLERAARGAIRGSFANAGQLCLATERLFVHAAVYEPFRDRLVERTASLTLGAGFDFEADVGSLISGRQLEKVERHVREAVETGATILAGGRARPDIGPFFYEPTVLEGVRPEAEIFSEETFGPVVSLYPVSSDEEAVERANEGCYGLNASVWTRDPDRGRRLAERIRAGTVNVNEAYSAAYGSVAAPMGGMRDSGLGRRHGIEGLLKYTEPQTVAVQRGVDLDLTGAGIARERYLGVVARALKMLRRVPGLR
ncbi:MAG: succinic semialdehyde dehydrogenase [Gemmatimonadota bacterium]